MNGKLDLKDFRDQIDEIDAQLVELFKKRMDVVGQVAKLKIEANIPVADLKREDEIVNKLAESTPNDIRAEQNLLIRTMLAISRSYQKKKMFRQEKPLFPQPAPPAEGEFSCAYQGVAGAWSEQALIKVFPTAIRQAVEHFEDVFETVRDGNARYGIVPIDNSSTGAIGETYDLLRKYGLYIVGRVTIKINQCLLAPMGTELNDIKRVLSHPQGFKQCHLFLRKYSWEERQSTNTAAAAKEAAAANDGVTAAIGSRYAAEQNNLQVLVPDIMDRTDNRTSFVVIAANPEYDEKSDRVSVSFTTTDRSGALCEALQAFLSFGVNMDKIESRPSTDGHFRFFANIRDNIMEEKIQAALRLLAAASEYFEVVGCYKEYGEETED